MSFELGGAHSLECRAKEPKFSRNSPTNISKKSKIRNMLAQARGLNEQWPGMIARYIDQMDEPRMRAQV